MTGESFSQRNRYSGAAIDITIREDAPESLRFVVLDKARELGWGPSRLRDILCRVLRIRPDLGNWSEHPNIWDEVQRLMYGCDWFKVYDVIEAMHDRMTEHDTHNLSVNAAQFAAEINAHFIETGIGWQLIDGKILTRGPEVFEASLDDAASALAETNRPTAAGRIHEALQDLSRRPAADLAGAITHAMGALEAVARDVTGDARATFGEILRRQPGLVPRPLDNALSQVWGYASNEARHVEEGREPERLEAELIVGLAATVASYLAKKTGTR